MAIHLHTHHRLALVSNSRLQLCLVVVIALLCAPQGRAQDEENPTAELPKLADMELPTFEELMTTEDPFDWLVLKDDSVLVTEPIFPRPDPLVARMKEKQELEAETGGSTEQRQARRDRLLELRKINVVLLEDSNSDYRIPLSQVAQIISFPRLMLSRIDQLLEAGEIRKAYEMLMQVEIQAPGWELSQPRFDALLLREANMKLDDNDTIAALALLDELAIRNIENQQLPIMMSQIIDGQIEAAMADEDMAKTKYFLSRLSRHFPQHPVVSKWEQQLQKTARQLLQKTQQLTAAGQHAEAAMAAKDAAMFWSASGTELGGNDRVLYTQAMLRYQILRVPVRRFCGEQLISPVPLEADFRHQELTTVPLFEPSGADELTYFQSSYFDLWDPQDLGREVVFSVRQTRPYWQSQPLLTANQIADTLADLLDPLRPTFNPRLASFVKEFSVHSPTELQVSFHRVPLNLEALFRFPIVGVPPEKQPAPPGTASEVLSTRFTLADETPDRRRYLRSVPEEDGLIAQRYHVAEIQEIKYPDRHAVIQAFNRNEVDVIPHLRPWEVDVFKSQDQFFVQKYAIPQTHVLVFNPMSSAVSSPQLRRALSFGIDREGLLKIVLLRDEEMKYGRPISAPWHTGSYANSPLVKVTPYDHYLSYLLRLAALEQLRIPDKQKFVADAKAAALAAKEDWDEEVFRQDHAAEINAAGEHVQLPKLRMLCDPDEMAMLPAEQMVKRWNALGFDVELISADRQGEPLGDEGWDIMYRRIRMEEPLLDLWPVLLTDDKFQVERLAGFPDWLRQELINLDYATSFIDAQQRLHTIHRHIAAQAFLIPLWEIDDFMVFRNNVKNFQGRPLSTYHGAERWVVTP
ncbi:ABC transporter substrate-binding protein [Fuerstiella marisgermanici]|uniref:ABC-type oligopeptide transport system, periplasmic component n=1 Tax=Fuerstiella marisgermanici TaxID=1891926 RepID=A0A1P8WBJ5_9PLAN|nr:ABC transporter substrate-binding protein [Fuerstiella marisgermanici]APZ91424.1 ABC-type oligopeptide transport system, periplasmic component [Fuerstiella marisgermanici]